MMNTNSLEESIKIKQEQIYPKSIMFYSGKNYNDFDADGAKSIRPSILNYKSLRIAEVVGSNPTRSTSSNLVKYGISLNLILGGCLKRKKCLLR
jgi:hypothetical protein